ncbi:hypothetical protein NM962_01285 [Mycobacterium sp. SVM_VP21]|nr:hypothetical protein NM962_01285 [Mycobacterium sp. SVM_VP21]
MSAWGAWLSDRDDERVQAALRRRCGLCGERSGSDCSDLFGRPLATGIVHMIRVPKRVLLAHQNGDR